MQNYLGVSEINVHLFLCHIIPKVVFFSFFEPPFSWDDYGGEGAEKWKCEETKIERLSLREFSQLVRSPQGGPGPRNRGRPTDDASLRIRRLQEKDTKAKKQWFALIAFPPLDEIPPHRFGRYMYNKQPDCKQKTLLELQGIPISASHKNCVFVNHFLM